MRMRRDDGAAAVEFALVSTLLFMLLFGIIAFGIALFDQQSAVQSAREAARQAAVGAFADCTAFDKYVQDDAAPTALHLTGQSLKADSGQDPGDPLVVQLDYTVDLSIVAWLPGIPDTLTLTQTATTRLEQHINYSSCA
jgi:hypothetical protein